MAERTLAVDAQSERPPLDLAAFSDGYMRLSRDHYLALAFMQAAVLASGADIAVQNLENAALDPGHVLAMGTVAATMSGAANAVWLRQLERAFPGTGAQAVAAKTIIHAFLVASIINSAYLIGVPLMTECIAQASLPPLTPDALLAGWTLDEFITLTKLEVCMFIPYNTVAFKFVPPRVRPLTHAMISAIFNVAVSAVTLGYFDTWCERAAALVGLA